MEKISLYIAGKKVDLDNNSFILFNYTMEDLSNPTIVKNSFSQSISLKGTPNNNKIFGNIYRTDRVTQYGETHTGIQFDPTRKTSFVLYNEMNEILEEGYVKLNKITRKNQEITYEISLFGGLGSFFYGLSSLDDGTKRTLADLDYFDMNGDRVSSFNVQPDVFYTTKDAWEYLAGDTSPFSKFWNIINFAPAYNGIPDKFDASKALFVSINASGFTNLVTQKVVDGVAYGLHTGASTRMMVFENPHSEWEIRDLRWYLQRPVLSVSSFMSAICDKQNNGGFDVVLDTSFFNESNPYYAKAWITLPMISEEFRSSSDCLNDVLQSSASPMDILLSYVKVYGLCFLYNSREKKVSIMTRKTFYQPSEFIDLTSRIDVSSNVEINPLVADSRYYQLGDSVLGQYAEEYKKSYQRDYGIQRINTGFEFNDETKILTKDLNLKDAIEVMEFNRMFGTKTSRYGNMIGELFLLPAYEKVVVQLWAVPSEGEDEQSQDVQIYANVERLRFDNPTFEYGDWLPKVQLHKDNKTEDGSYVMLFFDGVKESTPLASQRKKYWLTNDHPDMALLNQGNPCWNLIGESPYSYTTKSLPSFRRNLVNEEGLIQQTWEWGVPLARGVPGIAGDISIYESWWKNYLSDLYDDDTKVMRCKVNLSGLLVNQTLLRRFFWYENTLWRLNKISNHSFTTEDLTECEFIKVNEINNYIG